MTLEFSPTAHMGPESTVRISDFLTAMEAGKVFRDAKGRVFSTVPNLYASPEGDSYILYDGPNPLGQLEESVDIDLELE